MTTWMHQRKGKLVGEIIRMSADGEWVDIQLSEKCGFFNTGEVVTAREDFLTEIEG